MGPRIAGGLAQALDDVVRRPDLGVSASEVDDGIALERRRLGDTREQRSEVLLR
jgi:hypothetical protein